MHFKTYRILSFVSLLVATFGQAYWYADVPNKTLTNTKIEILLTKRELAELKSHIPDEVITDKELSKIIWAHIPNSTRSRISLGLRSKDALDRKRGFAIDGPVAVNKKSGLMWMRCPSTEFFHNGKCAVRVRGYDTFDLMSMLNEETMYGYNDWRIANIREIAEILDEKNHKIIDGVKLSNRTVRTALFDEEDSEYFYSSIYLPSKNIKTDRWRRAFFVRGGGAKY
ncbi:MAG: hypothetical protein CL578_05585 [Alteromonadaceae bacterium]|uniref:Lcl domain-containing protein n=1 Tax=uncultured Paraglaciecola sp. TaxID=1765024 RepID=UPI000C486BE0|nr:hypothetical protein [Alteromonadaceae bacterium]|tara:strand:+ start:46943 stop:47620 length:678 start_codon:yes stop_codon:yes gene_type:complete